MWLTPAYRGNCTQCSQTTSHQEHRREAKIGLEVIHITPTYYLTRATQFFPPNYFPSSHACTFSQNEDLGANVDNHL